MKKIPLHKRVADVIEKYICKRLCRLSKSNANYIRTLIYIFFEGDDNMSITRLGVEAVICYYTIRNSKITIIIDVTLQRPGLLIGVRGTTIDALTEYINRQIKYPVKIKIRESQLWKIKYRNVNIKRKFKHSNP